MSIPTIYNFNTFSIPSITFEDPVRIEENDQYLARAGISDCVDEASKRLFFQTPILKTKAGIKIQDGRCYLDVYLTNENESFINFIHHLDQYNIENTHKKSINWFNQTFDQDVIEDFYVSTIRNFTPEPNQNTHQNTNQKQEQPHTYIRLNIPIHKNQPYINIYNQDKEYIQAKRIKRDMPIIAILEFKGLSFLKNKFVCDINIVQIKAFIQKNTVNLTQYLSEMDEESKLKEQSKVVNDKPSLSSIDESLLPSKKDLLHDYTSVDQSKSSSISESDCLTSSSDDIPSIMPVEGEYNKDVIDEDMLLELSNSKKKKKHIHRLSQKVERLQKDALHTAKELQRFSQNI